MSPQSTGRAEAREPRDKSVLCKRWASAASPCAGGRKSTNKRRVLERVRIRTPQDTGVSCLRLCITTPFSVSLGAEGTASLKPRKGKTNEGEGGRQTAGPRPRDEGRAAFSRQEAAAEAPLAAHLHPSFVKPESLLVSVRVFFSVY